MILSKALRAAAGNIAPAPPSTDPQFNYVSMLLHGDGTNGAQNNTFIDSSTNNFTITRNGNTTQGSLSPYGSLWSNWFSGGGSDWLTVGGGMPSGQGTEFTLEFWAYATTAKEHAFTQGTTAGTLDFSVNASGAVYVADTGVVTIATSANGAFPYRSWVHIALTRTAGNLYTIYINGVSVGTGTNSTSMTANTTIGKHRGSTSRYFQGYLSNWRVTNTLVYTSNFTTPTAPLTAITNTSLLTCQSNRFIDNSANNFTITRNGDVRVTKEAPFLPTAAYSTSVIGGSGYFDGTDDYLTAPSGTAFNFGSGDFTAECWVYLTSFGSGVRIFGQTDSSGTALSTSILLGVSSGTVTAYLGYGSSSFFISASGPTAITTNAWHHLAVVRNGSEFRVYVNGAQGASTNVSGITVSSSTEPFTVGRNGSYNGFYVPGYVSNLRIVKGTAVYTSAFTPPTAPLTAITNTSLLLNFTNAGIFDNAAENDLETVGNAQISTSVKKYGTGSLAFDGNADWLFSPAGQNLNVSTGDFTIEGWVYAVTNSAGVIASVSDGNTITSATQLTWVIYFSGGSLIGRIYIGASFINVGTTAVSTATWTHFALVRNGSVFTFYVNGTSAGTYTSSSALNFGSNWKLGVGSIINDTSAGYLNGYIDDLRITKGYARYTSNFTPPTQAFPDQ